MAALVEIHARRLLNTSAACCVKDLIFLYVLELWLIMQTSATYLQITSSGTLFFFFNSHSIHMAKHMESTRSTRGC